MNVTYRAVHPWTAIKIPRGFGAHRIAKDGAHVLAPAQLAEHTAHRRAGKALLVGGVGEECGPYPNTADADYEKARPGTL